MQHEIINSPSASTIAILRNELKGRKPASKTVAVLADPIFSIDDERFKSLAGAQNSVSPQRAAPDDVDSLALARTARESSMTFKRLPFTRKEGDRILSLFPPTQRLQAFDFAASRTTATNPELSKYQIVHFATHGILNSKNPELSGVVLSLFDDKGTPQNGFRCFPT
jgi:CHAT domain